MTSASETVRAVLMHGPGRPLEHVRLPAPRPRPGGAVLETVASEVCGTDVHLSHGRLSGVPYPIIPGHVNVGRVLEANGPLSDIEGRAIPLGALVTFYDVYGICGACWHCLVARAATRCPHRRVYGITAPASEGLLGGWAERIEILPGVKLLVLPEGIGAENFLGGGCGLPTGFHAIERGGVAMGDTVVVQGSGPVGLNAAIFAQLSGALRVFVIGAPRARLDAALKLGAEDVLDVTEIARARGPRRLGPASGRPAAAPTSSSRRRAIPPPCPRASRCCATPGATSSSASTPTAATWP